jgi:acyl-coenzyme A synthetase/AMP-(fatty) acid ligase
MPLLNDHRLSLGGGLGSPAGLRDRFLAGSRATVALRAAIEGSCLDGGAEELRGRSVLLLASDQLAAALALLELDGIAQRLVLCPPDFPREHLRYVMEAAGVNAIVSDHEAGVAEFDGVPNIACGTTLVPADRDHTASHETEWVLLTSGTTGLPKLVVHTLASLAGAIQRNSAASPVVWSTFYDIRRYGGLQIFLRAILTGASMVFSSADEPTADFLARAGGLGVTHISGTPSHWRRALMSPAANMIAPQYVRLSGEIADQAVLNHLRSCYPQARVAHAFASTEAGLAFEVNDGLAGFPANLIGTSNTVEMKIEDGSLQVRSARIASRYLGPNAEPLTCADGFVDTRDMLELRGDRYYFVGRRDGVINIGGLKVHPEEVEAVINRHPQVRMSLVRTRKNPITGAVVVAEVVLKSGASSVEVKDDILLLCRKELASHKVPASIKFVPALAVAESGKLTRA